MSEETTPGCRLHESFWRGSPAVPFPWGKHPELDAEYEAHAAAAIGEGNVAVRADDLAAVLRFVGWATFPVPWPADVEAAHGRLTTAIGEGG